jgi:hypothetical protein
MRHSSFAALRLEGFAFCHLETFNDSGGFAASCAERLCLSVNSPLFFARLCLAGMPPDFVKIHQ